MVKQISVFLENKKGRLAALTQALSNGGIDLIALSIADTTNYGILRCIVSDTDKALKIFAENGFTAALTDVIAVQVQDKPGGLAKVLEVLDTADISIEYLYSFVRNTGDDALVLFRVENVKEAISVLTASGIKVLTQSEVGAL